jgi:F-type H+-transporting ATPase subunit epsilon
VAHEQFQVEVLTPEGQVFEGEVEMVSTRTTVGSIGVLAHHAPLLAMLDPAELRLYQSESDVVSFVQGEGYLQVGDNRALLLVEEAHEPGELNASDLRERLTQAEQGLERAEAGSEEERTCQRDKRRWETFLQIVEGGESR